MQLNLRGLIGTGVLLGALMAPLAMAVQVVNYRSPSTAGDQYELYTLALLTLALDKTRADYGEYLLQPLPAGVNRLRAKKALTANEYPALVIEDSYDGTELTDVTYIPFPIDLGVLSYRVCFVNPQVQERVAAAHTLEDMKAFSVLQGINWADTEILKANGFHTVEMASYKSYFRMVASGRADLFCLGANQVMGEYLSNSVNLSLYVDSSFYFYYRLPRFFYFHQSQQALKERVERGLLRAYRDKSLQALWLKSFSKSLDFVQLKQRKRFYLENPLITNLNLAYEQFILPQSSMMNPSFSVMNSPVEK